MILECQNITKSFGGTEVLEHASFLLEDYEKAALVGNNGAGKTTLLRIVTGESTPDSGLVVLAKGKSLGYLPQNPVLSGNRSIYEEVLSAKENIIQMEERLRQMEGFMAGTSQEELADLMETYHRLQHEFEQLEGHTYKSEVVGVLKGLGFDSSEFAKRMKDLSGGQRTRVYLGKLLVTKPDVLLLDEPTNHLDIGSVAWLEGFLSNYKGAVLLVSHDRYFLDKVVTKVVDLDLGKTQSYLGNYTEYAKKKIEIRQALIHQYYNQQKEIKRQEEVITKLKSFNREKSIRRAQSREKMLDKMERLDKPPEEVTDMKLELEPNIRSGTDVLDVEGLGKAFPGQVLFSNISFSIRRGERVALIGDNGTGKTTLLKILNQMVDLDSGGVTFGTNVHVGYYDQEHQVLHMEKNLMEEISDAYPDLPVTKIRNVLAAFLFTGDDVFKRIGDLSGGERGRVSLAKLMLSEANFLILDEPTNHLDIASKEILEQALREYTGTILFVSHDRYFINQVGNRILDLKGEVLTNYLGNYDYYLEKKDLLSPKANAIGEEQSQGGGNKADYQQRKEEQARKRKQENDLKKLETQIEKAEERIAQLEGQMSDPAVATNSAKLGALHDEYKAEKEKLEEHYETWEEMVQ